MNNLKEGVNTMSSFRLSFGLLVLLTLNSFTLNAQWTQVLPSQNGSFFALKLKGTLNFFAGSDVSGVFRTTNNGMDWDTVNTGLNDLRVHAFAVMGTNIFTGTLGGVFLSTNNGTNWTPVNSGLTNLNVYPLTVSGPNLFAGTSNSGVFLSTNNGTSWTPVNSGLTNLEVNALTVNGTNIFAGTNGGVFLSTDNGTSWTTVNSGLTNNLATCFCVSGTDLFVGTYGGGVFLSTNNGTSWTPVNPGLTSLDILSLLAVDGLNILVGTDGEGVFLSTNNGTSWTPINSGLTNLSVLSLAVVGMDLFAGTSGGSSNGVWRRPVSEIITSIKTTPSNEIPSVYALLQNYPNPFNPNTNIEFSIPESEFVTLKAYNILGDEVAKLVSQKLPAGSYKYNWDASNFSSGIYFYKIQAGNFVKTKKMMLMK